PELLQSVMFPAPPHFQLSTSSTANSLLPWTDVTDQEIREAIFTSTPKKAAGPDGLSFLCLREAYNAIPTWFHQLFCACIVNAYHPLCWREAKGAILAKPSKPDYQAPKSYRIIALLNCLGKIAEKLVAKRLSPHCEDNHLLHEGQMGGRPHRSATAAILALTHDVELGKQQHLVTSALFMDVKGAFD